MARNKYTSEYTKDEVEEALCNALHPDTELDSESKRPVENRAIAIQIDAIMEILAGQEKETLAIAAKDGITSLIVKPSDESATIEFNVQHYFTSLSGTRYQSDPVQYEVYTVKNGQVVTILTGNGTTNTMMEETIDRATWLGLSGTTYVYVKASLIGSGVTVSPLGYSITVTSLDLDTTKLNWNTPYIEGKSYAGIGPVDIYGNVEKTYFIRVQGELYDKTYEVRTDSATSQPTNVFFTGLEMPSEGTGVYKVSMWLESKGTPTEAQTYNMMFIADEDANTAQLVCMNEVKEIVTNGTANDMFAYSFYNKGLATASNAQLAISYSKNAGVIVKDTDTLGGNTGVKYKYSPNVNVETSEESLTIDYKLTYGDCVQNEVATLDNSNAYTAVPDPTFYLNPGKRSNQQENRETVINEANSEEISASYTKFSWVDGVDGYTVDDAGRKCLRVPANSSIVANKSLMSSVYSTTRGKVLEFSFKTANVSDYDEAVIEISSSKTSSTFSGIRIKPANITVHSNGINNPSEDAIHGYNFMDEENVHILVCIIPSLASAGGKNVCIIYANGSRKCVFAYDSSDSWTNSGKLVLGSSSADLFVYAIRTYDLSFISTDALRNYYTSLGTNTERDTESAKDKAVLYGESVKMEKVKEAGLNYFLVEMLNGAALPHYGLSKSYSAQCNLEMYLQSIGHAFKLVNQKIEGQGTTSMDYDKWNLRWRVDKNGNKVCDVYYLVDGEWVLAGTLNKFDFDGIHATLKRLTAKTNFASSMQSHKMGATMAYNDLHKACVGFADDAESGMDLSKMRTSIYQYPVYGFTKTWNEESGAYEYEFIGLFTVGPDKGDKDSIGWKQWDDANKLLSMEGVDHSPKLAQFAYPWNDEVAIAYDSAGDKTCLSLVNPSTGDTIEYAWEVGNCHGLNSSAWLAELEKDFKPGYLLAYECGQNITVVDNISQASSSANEYIVKGDDAIYYYRLSSGTYAKSMVGGTEYNWYTQYTRNGGTKTKAQMLALSNSEMAEEIKAARRNYFAEHIWEYFNKQDTLFHLCFLVLFGASDNFAKNTYPYKLAAHLWRWFQDDLDTLFDINNQSIPGKDYYIEYGDKQSSGAYWFNGKTSNLWNTINESCKADIKSMMQTILKKMAEIGYANDATRSTWFDRIVGFVHDYFWKNAQEYFARGAYNADATYKYEDAYSKYPTSYNPGVNPLTQSLGSHYEAERWWVERRLLYVMSEYQIGPFVDYTADSSMGQIVWRAVGAFTITITPAITMFPTIIAGANNSYLRPSDRVLADNTCTLSFDAGENDTNVYIKSADWLASVGDFKDIQLLSTNTTLAVTGKRLQEWKSGDKDGAAVTTNVTRLEFGQCPSMEKIDCHNVTSLTTVTGTDSMLRLTEAYFGGTNLATLPLAEGSKIETLELPGTLTSISMVSMNFLTSLTYDGLSRVTSLRVEDCRGIDQLQMLRDCMQGNALSKLRITDLEQSATSADIDMLKKIAESSITGLDATGADTPNPVVEGTLDLGGKNLYQASLTAVRSKFYNLNIIGIGAYYIPFADENVLEHVLTARDGFGNLIVNTDGIGVTYEQAAAAVSVGTVATFNFYNRQDITSFDEFQYFTSVTNCSSFQNCKNLASVVLPNSIVNIGNLAFYNCTSLKSIKLPYGLKVIENMAFANSSISGKLTLPTSLTSLGSGAFNSTKLKSVDVPCNIELKDNTFRSISTLTSVTLADGVVMSGNNIFRETAIASFVVPTATTTIGEYSFYLCASLASVAMHDGVRQIDRNAFDSCVFESIELNDNISSIGDYAFKNCSNLNSLHIPTSVTEISNGLLRYSSNIHSVELHNGVTKIGVGSFQDCSELEDITLYNSITEIGDGAFTTCKKAKINSLPSGLTKISQNCFHNCNVMTASVIPSGVTSIGAYAFNRCYLVTFSEIPSSVTSIGDMAFGNCTAMQNIKVLATTPPTITSTSFHSTHILYVPDAALSDYASASVWNTLYAEGRLKPISQYP